VCADLGGFWSPAALGMTLGLSYQAVEELRVVLL
jgi:hypothetical protein